MTEKNKDTPKMGWICPRCGSGNAPSSIRCPCVQLPIMPLPLPLGPINPSPLPYEVTCVKENDSDHLVSII
jgi:hypothetical protein